MPLAFWRRKTNAPDDGHPDLALPAPSQGVTSTAHAELDTTADLQPSPTRERAAAAAAYDESVTLHGSNGSAPAAVGSSVDGRALSTIRDDIGLDGDVPRLHGFHLWHRKWSNLAYATFILLCNLAAPCLLYYPLKEHTDLSEHALLGIASATLGISSSFDNPFRMVKLWKHRDLYGPLGDPVRWHMDWTMHLYSFSLFPIFAIPLAISSSVNPPLQDFFLMSTPMLVSVPGLFFLYTLFRPKCPCWVSSDPPGTPMKPGVFYLFEDIGAVDFRHGKEFRRVLHERYNASPIYRDMMYYQTVWWAYGCFMYFAAVAATTWTWTFNFNFGFVLGLLFIWLLLWSIASLLIARYFKGKERRWVDVKRRDPEFARRMTREGKSEDRRLSRQLTRERRDSRKSLDRERSSRRQGAEGEAVQRAEGTMPSPPLPSANDQVKEVQVEKSVRQASPSETTVTRPEPAHQAS